ncbi:unnamed protein product [Penicillium roqueforti FM164]|uniref:Genomic scaffold, ProqFM164S04 n=1 Tax=Penicillium roqueforti (strain FM164) TaxID=1365484 RepID=W6QGW9_PENRF|nr:unnamed protein product [Penicillium roqueforti FM164]
MDKRQADGPWSLYAYGNNVDGLPIFYADDAALRNIPVTLRTIGPASG